MASWPICRSDWRLLVALTTFISNIASSRWGKEVNECCLGGISRSGSAFDCSMRGQACCLETGNGSPLKSEDLNAHVLASIFDCDCRERIYSWVGSSETQYACIVFRLGDEETIARFPDLAVIGVARHGSERHPVCLRHSSDFNIENNRNLRQEAREMGCDEWHIHFAGNFQRFCRDFAHQHPHLVPLSFELHAI